MAEDKKTEEKAEKKYFIATITDEDGSLKIDIRRGGFSHLELLGIAALITDATMEGARRAENDPEEEGEES